MFGSSQKSVKQKPLKDANFLSIYVYVYKCMFVRICLHASGGRYAKTERSSYGSCETKNKLCGSCILTTKRVTQTNYYDIAPIFNTAPVTSKNNAHLKSDQSNFEVA